MRLYINKSVALFVFSFLLLLEYPVLASQQRSDLTGIWSELVIRSATTLGKECPTCMRLINNLAAEEAIRLSRVESIKNAILESLGLSEPPNINISSLILPFPIKNGDVFDKNTNYEDEGKEEDKASQNPSKVMIVSSGPSAKETEYGFEVEFKIEIPWNVQSAELSSAVLWLHTDTEANSNKCKVYSKPCSDNNNNFNYYQFIPSDSNEFKDGWTQIDLSLPFYNWMEYEEFCQEIKLNCNDRLNEIYNSINSDDTTNKPFIIVNITPATILNRNRNKRNINCIPSSTECCRERLVISFSQINWDWIIQPASFEAYYCKGRCEDVAAISLANTPYYSALQKLRLNTEGKDKYPELRSCCAPKHLSSLQIIYLNQNKTPMETSIPNMAVTSCGCT